MVTALGFGFADKGFFLGTVVLLSAVATSWAQMQTEAPPVVAGFCALLNASIENV